MTYVVREFRRAIQRFSITAAGAAALEGDGTGDDFRTPPATRAAMAAACEILAEALANDSDARDAITAACLELVTQTAGMHWIYQLVDRVTRAWAFDVARLETVNSDDPDLSAINAERRPFGLGRLALSDDHSRIIEFRP
jgi:hypothetical protein